MDPEEYEQTFGYLSHKKYPNDIKESEKKFISPGNLQEQISHQWNL
jgi:hypothetical protein